MSRFDNIQNPFRTEGDTVLFFKRSLCNSNREFHHFIVVQHRSTFFGKAEALMKQNILFKNRDVAVQNRGMNIIPVGKTGLVKIFQGNIGP